MRFNYVTLMKPSISQIINFKIMTLTKLWVKSIDKLFNIVKFITKHVIIIVPLVCS